MLSICASCNDKRDSACRPLPLLLQVMVSRKVKYMVVRDSAAAWSETAPYFLFSATGTKEELKAALHGKLDHRGDVSLFLRDNEGDFADWDEPIALPTSGTICVKVATDTLSAGNVYKKCELTTGNSLRHQLEPIHTAFELWRDLGLIYHPSSMVKMPGFGSVLELCLRAFCSICNSLARVACVYPAGKLVGFCTAACLSVSAASGPGQLTYTSFSPLSCIQPCQQIYGCM